MCYFLSTEEASEFLTGWDRSFFSRKIVLRQYWNNFILYKSQIVSWNYKFLLVVYISYKNHNQPKTRIQKSILSINMAQLRCSAYNKNRLRAILVWILSQDPFESVFTVYNFLFWFFQSLEQLLKLIDITYFFTLNHSVTKRQWGYRLQFFYQHILVQKRIIMRFQKQKVKVTKTKRGMKLWSQNATVSLTKICEYKKEKQFGLEVHLTFQWLVQFYYLQNSWWIYIFIFHFMEYVMWQYIIGELFWTITRVPR